MRGCLTTSRRTPTPWASSSPTSSTVATAPARRCSGAAWTGSATGSAGPGAPGRRSTRRRSGGWRSACSSRRPGRGRRSGGPARTSCSWRTMTQSRIPCGKCRRGWPAARPRGGASHPRMPRRLRAGAATPWACRCACWSRMPGTAAVWSMSRRPFALEPCRCTLSVAALRRLCSSVHGNFKTGCVPLWNYPCVVMPFQPCSWMRKMPPVAYLGLN
mmetsp:Transcript_83252/g.236177  ORF Transcript_83252/g.236177 Transcript_83252/m.236177 type:complete len:216 (+) Transcript_83252:641-1288(+)